ncbi:hypothetical protein [Streptomyces sp. NBC_01264]|uniref:hypothetical protein n=1 Tax=Streptomyces sp. NBC_01264 TaxID=2903804 RepID=UPI002257161B|nr:hypothetical protein [Streptomyces sp. NBC_01264]MCX4776295.1 hypothetical protein [Streptomyces sp. NBC_01264]
MPLIIVALAVAAGCLTGCVTVGPAGPGAVPGSGASPVPTQVRAGLPGPADGAAPLGTLPEVPPDAAPVPVPVPVDASTPAPRAAVAGQQEPPRAPAAARPRSRVKPAAPRHRPERPRRASPKKPAAPAAKARRARPAPNRSYDMAPLCAAARGTVDPAIVALCH